MNRVVITGIGLHTCIGSTVDEAFSNALNAQSKLLESPNLPAGNAIGQSISPEILGREFSPLENRMLDRCAMLAVSAARAAVLQSGLRTNDDPSIGVFVGSGYGGANAVEVGYESYLLRQTVAPLVIPKAMVHASAANIAINLRVLGPCLTYATACASGATAIGEAFHKIRSGFLECVVAGGSEAMLTPVLYACWNQLGVLARSDGAVSQGCRPFDRERQGFHLAEGAAFVVLESERSARARGANILGEIVGYGCSNDSVHIAKPDVRGQTAAVRSALRDAAICEDRIGYINAHGTATRVGDLVESQAIRLGYGNHAPKIGVSSTKAVHGHTIGASGAIEGVLTVSALRLGILPPTAHLKNTDIDCDLDYISGDAREVPGIEYAASHSFAFGGANVVLVFRRYNNLARGA
jgi:3-oxoacyl-[acyl-carrier-protein] synthase II